MFTLQIYWYLFQKCKFFIKYLHYAVDQRV